MAMGDIFELRTRAIRFIVSLFPYLIFHLKWSDILNGRMVLAGGCNHLNFLLFDGESARGREAYP